jgi:hypothetical protein
MLKKILLVFFFLSNPVLSKEISKQSYQYIFGWMFNDQKANLSPRGGNTLGPDSELDKQPSENWISLQEAGISNFEKDRRAILSMLGQYRVSFDFVEVAGFKENFTPARPYQSWATEFVYLIEDRKNFISLQHVLVMFFKDNDGKISDPMVTKHWRQDWHFQDSVINEYKADDTWNKRTLSFGQIKGKWSQSVYQVDDSPRYQSIGKWRHKKGYSEWISAETWRPLPRREFSIRNDYDLLIGTNKQTITPNGWIHEQSNLKVILNDDSQQPIAKEIGLAKYERIKNHDWSAGELYIQNTYRFWKLIRDSWSKILDQNDSITIKQYLNNQALYQSMFIMAEKTSGTSISEENELVIKNYLNTHIVLNDREEFSFLKFFKNFIN